MAVTEEKSEFLEFRRYFAVLPEGAAGARCLVLRQRIQLHDHILKIQTHQEVRENISSDQTILIRQKLLLRDANRAVVEFNVADLHLFSQRGVAGAIALIADPTELHIRDLD